MAIIVSKKGMGVQKIEKSSIKQEEYLQKYIYDNPETIPLDDIKEDIRLLVMAREFPTKSGSIDALAFDRDGDIYIIETKLYKNPDKRLVVAQILDYGASLWHSYRDFTEVLGVLEGIINKKFGIGLNQKLKEFFSLNEEEVSSLLDGVKTNLDSGNFKFVVLMDQLHDQLKDLITFINQNSRFDIYGCELDLYKYDDYKILIPSLYGTEVKKSVGTSSARKKWDEGSFFEDVRRRLEKKGLKSIQQLYDYSRNSADQISWGTGATRGSFNPKYSSISVRSVFTVFSDGVLQINFGWLNDNESTKSFRKLLKKNLENIDGLSFTDDYEEKHFCFRIEEWDDKVKEIVNVLDNVIGEKP